MARENVDAKDRFCSIGKGDNKGEEEELDSMHLSVIETQLRRNEALHKETDRSYLVVHIVE